MKLAHRATFAALLAAASVAHADTPAQRDDCPDSPDALPRTAPSNGTVTRVLTPGQGLPPGYLNQGPPAAPRILTRDMFRFPTSSIDCKRTTPIGEFHYGISFAPAKGEATPPRFDVRVAVGFYPSCAAALETTERQRKFRKLGTTALPGQRDAVEIDKINFDAGGFIQFNRGLESPFRTKDITLEFPDGRALTLNEACSSSQTGVTVHNRK